MLEEMTNTERRQALCRTIFFLDDRSFSIIEGIVREYQAGEIRKKLKELGQGPFPPYFNNDPDQFPTRGKQ